MKAALILALAAACGDNIDTGVHLDAGYADKDHSRFFAIVNGLGPEPARTITPVTDASLCIGELCTTTSSNGTFVLVGTGPGIEATLVATEPSYITTIMPVIGGAAGDRNLSQVLLVSPELDDQIAAAFQADPMLDTRGIIVVEATRNDTGKVQLVIDGLTPSYLNEMQLPDPTRTQLANAGGAIFYAAPPGEAILRTTAGHCDPAASGWPGSAPGDIRVPVVAGQLTLVYAICAGI